MMKYGISSSSITSIIAYGVILNAKFFNIEAGYAAGQAALRLVEKYNFIQAKSGTRYVVYHCLVHWKEPLRATIKPRFDSVQIGIDNYNPEFAGWNAQAGCNALYHAGAELTTVEREMEKRQGIIDWFGEGYAATVHKILRQNVENLLGKTTDPLNLIGDFYNEQEELPIHIKEKNGVAIANVFIYKLFAAFLFEEYVAALGIADGPWLAAMEAIISTYNIVVYNMYASLTYLANCAPASAKEGKRLIKKALKNQKSMKKWAFHGPMNFQHKYDLVEAEIARVRGDDLRAEKLYDAAIAGARKNEYLQEEALANELAAKCCLDKGRDAAGMEYLKSAYYLYQKWEAWVKVRQLEEKYIAPLEQG